MIDNQFVHLEATITDFSSAHNVYVNSDSGFAYIVGPDPDFIGGGILVEDLSNPVNPQFAGYWPSTYVHDIQVVSYTEGPLAGREIAFAFAGELGAISRLL